MKYNELLKGGGGLLVIAMVVSQVSTSLGGYVGLFGLILIFIGFIVWVISKFRG